MMAVLPVPFSPATTSVTSRRGTDDVLVDMSKLMDDIRREIMTEMQDSLQRSAAACAQLCAKRIVGARREMHQRFQEQKLDIERLHGIKISSNASAASTAKATPTSKAFPMLSRSNTPRSAQTPRSAVELPRRKVASASTPRTMARAADFDSAYVNYIEAHSACQDLEDKTRQAKTALDLIEQAINVTSTASDAAFRVETASARSDGAQRTEAITNGPIVDAPISPMRVGPIPSTWSDGVRSMAHPINAPELVAVCGAAAHVVDELVNIYQEEAHERHERALGLGCESIDSRPPAPYLTNTSANTSIAKEPPAFGTVDAVVKASAESSLLALEQAQTQKFDVSSNISQPDSARSGVGRNWHGR